jgi:hypothetical protein
MPQVRTAPGTTQVPQLPDPYEGVRMMRDAKGFTSTNCEECPGVTACTCIYDDQIEKLYQGGISAARRERVLGVLRFPCGLTVL